MADRDRRHRHRRRCVDVRGGTSITSCGAGTGDGSNTTERRRPPSASASHRRWTAVPRVGDNDVSSVMAGTSPRLNLPRACDQRIRLGRMSFRVVTFSKTGSANQPSVPGDETNVDAAPSPSRTDATVRPSASTTTSMNCSHNCDTTSLAVHTADTPSDRHRERRRNRGRLRCQSRSSHPAGRYRSSPGGSTSDRHLRIRRRMLEDLQ